MGMLNTKKVNEKGILFFQCDTLSRAKIQLQLSSSSQTLKLDNQPAEFLIFNITTYSSAHNPIKGSRVRF